MYDYIRKQWIMANVTADWVMACVPKFITAEQCTFILEIPQTPGTLTTSKMATV